MNLIYAEMIKVFFENGMRFGKIRIGGAMKNVSLELVTNATPGDTVLMCDGVALSKVGQPQMETIHVPRDSR